MSKSGWRGAMLCLALGLLVACGGPDPYRQESFADLSPYKRSFAIAPEKACEAANLTALEQGYKLARVAALDLSAEKSFQADDEFFVIELNVSCREHQGKTFVFANAVQSKFQPKKTSQSTSIGIPSVGSLSLPTASSVDSLVRVGGATVSDKSFYERFFAALQRYLGPAGK